MRFYLSDDQSTLVATEFVIPIIASIIDSASFVDQVETGLIKAKFIKATSDNFSPTSTSDGDTNEDTSLGNGSMGLTSVILVTAGGAALFVFVASVYYWRRSYNNVPINSAATQAAGSSMNETGDESTRQYSPFSEMLPDAYRFNENMSILSGQGGMSAIIEDEEVYSHASSSLLMSDAGYSTEAAAETDSSLLSMDIPKSLYTRAAESPNLLGARKRNPDQIMSAGGDDTSVSDLETTDDEGSPNRKKHSSALPDALLDPEAGKGFDEIHNESPDDSMHADDLLLFC